jgi:hypothetical protein
MKKLQIISLAFLVVLACSEPFFIMKAHAANAKETKRDEEILSKKEKKELDDTIAFIESTSPEIKSEVETYRTNFKELKDQSQHLYENLSKEAKAFLAEEKLRMDSLSETAKKELKKKLKE